MRTTKNNEFDDAHHIGLAPFATLNTNGFIDAFEKDLHGKKNWLRRDYRGIARQKAAAVEPYDLYRATILVEGNEEGQRWLCELVGDCDKPKLLEDLRILSKISWDVYFDRVKDEKLYTSIFNR